MTAPEEAAPTADVSDIVKSEKFQNKLKNINLDKWLKKIADNPAEARRNVLKIMAAVISPTEVFFLIRAQKPSRSSLVRIGNDIYFRIKSNRKSRTSRTSLDKDSYLVRNKILISPLFGAFIRVICIASVLFCYNARTLLR